MTDAPSPASTATAGALALGALPGILEALPPGDRPEGPWPTLVIGAADPATEGELDPRLSVVRVADWAQAGALEGPWHAVVAPLPPGTPDAEVRAGAHRMHVHLAADGVLMLAVTFTTSGDPPLAPRDPELRRVVRILSEAGFALERDLDRSAPAGEAPPERVLVCRKDPYVVRAYRDGDEQAILRLFRTCFDVERSLEHWRWKYRDSPWGAHHVALAFSPEGELAAHYAGYPVPYWRAGRDGRPARTSMALQVGDTMTHPARRDHGRDLGRLLPRTVRHFFVLNLDPRFAFYYGFNTGGIRRFSERHLQGFIVDRVHRWVHPAPREAFAPGDAYRVERVREVDDRFDRLFADVAPRYGFLAQRDARWVAWRHLGCPDPGIVVLAAHRGDELVGWGSFRPRGPELRWGDALFRPGHPGAVRAVLAAAAREPALAVEGPLVSWFSPRPAWWRETLEQLGLTLEPEPSDLALIAMIGPGPGDGPGVEAEELLHELHHAMADGDLY